MRLSSLDALPQTRESVSHERNGIHEFRAPVCETQEDFSIADALILDDIGNAPLRDSDGPQHCCHMSGLIHTSFRNMRFCVRRKPGK